jgi:hypothetical protein
MDLVLACWNTYDDVEMLCAHWHDTGIKANWRQLQLLMEHSWGIQQ